MRVIWHIGIMWKFSLVVLLATSVISQDVNNRRSWNVKVPSAEELLPFLPNRQENEAPAPLPNDINLQVPLLPNDGAPSEVPQAPNGQNSPLTPSDGAPNGVPAPGPAPVPQQNGPYYPSNIFPTGHPSAVSPPNGLPSQYLPYQYGGIMNSPSSAPTDLHGLNPALANFPSNILSNLQHPSARSPDSISPNTYFQSSNYGQYPVPNIPALPFHVQNPGPVQNVPPGGSNSFFGAVNIGMSPHLNLPTNVNCKNTEVLLKVWTIFSNLLDTGGNPVQTPDADQIKFALILIKKYLQEAPQNAANVDIATKLMELETDLLKNKGVILQDDRPLSSLLTYNPVIGPSVSFKYELPTNMRPACRKAFLSTIETAQEAYRNLAKSAICTGSAEVPQYPNNGYLHPGYAYNLPVDPNHNPYGSASDTQNPQSPYIPPVSPIPPAKSDNALQTILDYLKNHDSRNPKEIEMNPNSLPTSYPYFPTIDTTKVPPNPSENRLNFDPPQNGDLTPNDLTVNQRQTPLSNPSGFNVVQPQSPFANLPGFNGGHPQSPFANLPGSKISQPKSTFTTVLSLNGGQPQSPLTNSPSFNVAQPQSPFANNPVFNVGQPQSPSTNTPDFNFGKPQSPFANLPGFNVGQPQSPFANIPDFNFGQPQSPFANLPGFNIGKPQSPFANIPGFNVAQPNSPLTNPLGFNIGQPQSPLNNQPEFNTGQHQPVMTIPLNIGQPQSPLSNPTGLNAGNLISPLNPTGFDFGSSQSPLSNIPFNIAQLFSNLPVHKTGQTQTSQTNPPAFPMKSPAFNFDHLPGEKVSPTPQSLFPLGDMDISSLITPNSPAQNDFPSYLKHIKNIADKLNALNPNQNVFRPGTDITSSPVNFNTNPTFNPSDKNSNMLQNMPGGNDALNNAYTLNTNPTQSYLVPAGSPDLNLNSMYPGKSSSPDLNNLNPYGTNSPLNSYQNPYQIPFDNTLLTNPNNYQLFPDKVPTNDLNTIANLGKLNPNTKNEIELTYVLKRPKPLVYQPFYFVKYRLPYNNFVKDVGKLMSQNSLRTSKADLYKNLIEMYNASEVPADLAHLPKEQVKDMVLRNGALYNARLIPSNETEAKGLDVIEKKINKVNLTNQVTVGLPIQISKAYPSSKNGRVKRNVVTDTGLDDKPSMELKPSLDQTGVLSEPLASSNVDLGRHLHKRSDFGAGPSSTILGHL